MTPLVLAPAPAAALMKTYPTTCLIPAPPKSVINRDSQCQADPIKNNKNYFQLPCRADWAEQLAGRIRLRADRRLRGLAISRERGQIFISSRATSFYVRRLAEHAAMELLPAERLRLQIEVV